MLGLCSVAVGVVAMLAPGITALVLIAVMGANAIVTGVFDLIAAVRLRKRGRNAWMLFLIGILSAVFGIVVLLYPGAGALALVWMIGTYALITGALLFVLGITARGWLRGGFSDKPSIAATHRIPNEKRSGAMPITNASQKLDRLFRPKAIEPQRP